MEIKAGKRHTFGSYGGVHSLQLKNEDNKYLFTINITTFGSNCKMMLFDGVSHLKNMDESIEKKKDGWGDINAKDVIDELFEMSSNSNSKVVLFTDYCMSNNLDNLMKFYNKYFSVLSVTKVPIGYDNNQYHILAKVPGVADDNEFIQRIKSEKIELVERWSNQS